MPIPSALADVCSNEGMETNLQVTELFGINDTPGLELWALR